MKHQGNFCFLPWAESQAVLNRDLLYFETGGWLKVEKYWAPSSELRKATHKEVLSQN